jgi:hypothetical protein
MAAEDRDIFKEKLEEIGMFVCVWVCVCVCVCVFVCVCTYI